MSVAGVVIAAQVFTHSFFEFASLSGVLMVAMTIGTAWLGFWNTFFLVTRRPAVVVDSAGVHIAWGLRPGRFIPWSRVAAVGVPVRRIETSNNLGNESVQYIHYIKVVLAPDGTGTTPRTVRKICPNPDRIRLRATVHAFAPHVAWRFHRAG
ncbi:hypothetical protein [Streptodolium elevatio]|uniref:PH domain-containing protein n=1 Tax=Streptodolium elevatio TaxID=3157996 RepID=A0ABV3DHE6_9ACTN